MAKAILHIGRDASSRLLDSSCRKAHLQEYLSQEGGDVFRVELFGKVIQIHRLNGDAWELVE